MRCLPFILLASFNEVMSDLRRMRFQMCKFVYFDESGKKFSNAQSLAVEQARDRRELGNPSSLQPRDRHQVRQKNTNLLYLDTTYVHSY